MPNQTPHTPQVPSTPEVNTLGMKPPIISPEIYERFEQLIAKPFSPEVIEACNKAQREKREREAQQNQTRQFLGNHEALEKSGLEPFNFQVDSSNWTYELDEHGKQKLLNGYPIKENPEKDIWEITMLDGTKEQLFTQDSALRETKKAGKTIPTGGEGGQWEQIWEQICELYGEDGERLSKELGLVVAGRRHWITGLCLNQSAYGFYWSSSPSTTDGFYLYFNSTNVRPTNNYNRAYGFSVRCFREGFKPETEVERNKKILNYLKRISR